MHELAAITGFLLLQRKILRVRNKSMFLLSPELLAHYLLIQCNLNRPQSIEVASLSFEADGCLAALLRYKILRRTGNKLLIVSGSTEDEEESRTCIVLPGKTNIAEILARISNC